MRRSSSRKGPRTEEVVVSKQGSSGFPGSFDNPHGETRSSGSRVAPKESDDPEDEPDDDDEEEEEEEGDREGDEDE